MNFMAEENQQPLQPNPERKTLDDRAKLTELERIRCPFASLLILALLVAFAGGGAMAAETRMPESVRVRHDQLAAKLAPAARNWVAAEVRKISKVQNPSGTVVRADIQSRFPDTSATGLDIDSLVEIVMFETWQTAEQELKDTLAEMDAINKQKAAQRKVVNEMKKEKAAAAAAIKTNQPGAVATSGNKKNVNSRLAATARQKDQMDTMGEISEERSLRLQQLMERKTQVEQTLSNILKTFSNTQSNLVQNLK